MKKLLFLIPPAALLLSGCCHCGATGGGIGATGKVVEARVMNELSDVAEAKKTAEGLRVDLKGDLLFKSGSSKLMDEAVKAIDVLGETLAKEGVGMARVTGHTDSSGGANLNMALSQRRANTVKHRLVKAGVPEDKIEAIGAGALQPIATNVTKEGRAANRRVEILIVE